MVLNTSATCNLPARLANNSGASPFDASTLNCNTMAIGDGVIYQANVIPPPAVPTALGNFNEVYTGYCTWQYYSSGVSITSPTAPIELCAEFCDCMSLDEGTDVSNAIWMYDVLRCTSST